MRTKPEVARPSRSRPHAPRIGLGILISTGLFCGAGIGTAGADHDLHAELPAYRLTHDAPRDARLQAALEAIDRQLGAELAIPAEARACGILDLTDLRLALVRGDAMFYGASVPKICILLAWFDRFPEAAAALEPEVERELGRMIKRSDNELAAKYSRLVGLDAIQRLQLSERYRLYDPERGGGLWSGKHYGAPEPRRGDPLRDLSHAATVRQCLRFHLMLLQERLVTPAASRAMVRIFASPDLAFHEDGFVAGLRGRDVELIRKNGLWEDWHLDTACIRHGRRVYLLAGIAHHPAGPRYLEELAARLDEVLCGSSPAPMPFRHGLVVHDAADAFRNGRATGTLHPLGPRGVELRPTGGGEAAFAEVVYESAEIAVPGGMLDFNEALLSWNVRAGRRGEELGGVRFDARVRRRRDRTWSPYLAFGSWGNELPDGSAATEFEDGSIAVDCFESEHAFDRLQYRIRARLPAGNGPRSSLLVRRMAVCFSDTRGIPGPFLADATPPGPSRPAPPPESWQRRLDVPLKRQATAGPELANRICSPTSVSMVMAYRGEDRTPLEVAGILYDAEHGIYGNWPRAVQGAFSLGVPGYLQRFSDWAEVERCIAAGQPLIISIRVGRGEMTARPDYSTAGHLVVLTGFDEGGDAEINDPAGPAGEGLRRYPREDLQRVWMRNGTGTAYVLLPREEG